MGGGKKPETMEELKAHAYDVFAEMQKLQEVKEVVDFVALQAELRATNDAIAKIKEEPTVEETPAE